MKSCSKCRELKSEEEFRLRPRGLNSSCRLCDAEYSRAWRKKNPLKMKASNIRFRALNPSYEKDRPIEAKERRLHLENLRRKTPKERAKRNSKRDYKQEYKYTVLRRQRIRAYKIPNEEKKRIARFYSQCPKGLVVDHIVPLIGDNVCGLHVLRNLQYLTRSDNSLKGKSFDGTWLNSSWMQLKKTRRRSGQMANPH